MKGFRTGMSAEASQLIKLPDYRIELNIDEAD